MFHILKTSVEVHEYSKKSKVKQPNFTIFMKMKSGVTRTVEIKIICLYWSLFNATLSMAILVRSMDKVGINVILSVNLFP